MILVLSVISGPEHLHPRLGDLIQAVTVDVIGLLPAVAVRHPHVAVVVTTPLVGMTGTSETMTVTTETTTAVIAIMIVATVIMTVATVNALMTAPGALMRGTVT